MSITASLAPILEKFFTQRLMLQRRVSGHTISSYRDSFKQLLVYANQQLNLSPSALNIEHIDAPLIVDFLDHLEYQQGVSIRSRNLRLTAIRSFFQYAAYELPTYAEHIQRVLAIPNKRFTRKLVGFLSRKEVDALLAAPDRNTWFGRRDHAFILTAVQTGLRVSEITSLTLGNLVIDSGAHVRVIGKGRKERCIPLSKPTIRILKIWLKEPMRGSDQILFPNANGKQLTVHGVQYLLKKHKKVAEKDCSSLESQHLTVHRLRHTMAMDLLQSGVDRSVIALWLGHESIETTQVYLDATLEMKEKALLKLSAIESPAKRFHPSDELLGFRNNL